jgi:hypothetical protein
MANDEKENKPKESQDESMTRTSGPREKVEGAKIVESTQAVILIHFPKQDKDKK